MVRPTLPIVAIEALTETAEALQTGAAVVVGNPSAAFGSCRLEKPGQTMSENLKPGTHVATLHEDIRADRPDRFAQSVDSDPSFS